MKVLVCADVHLGATTHGRYDPSTGLNSRQVEFLRCLEWTLDYAQKSEFNLFVVAGDLFDSRVPSIDLLTQTKQLLSRNWSFPILIIAGNHSVAGITSRASPIDVLEITGRVWTMRGKPGVFNPSEYLGPEILCLPFPVRDTYLTPEEIEGRTQSEVETLVVERACECLTRYCDQHSGIELLIGHCSVQGSIVDACERGATLDYEFPVEFLLRLPTKLVVLGHVHYDQDWKRRVLYTGPLTVSGFGEQCNPGFVELERTKGKWTWTRRELPSDIYRKPTTFEICSDDFGYILHQFDLHCTRDSVVRFRIQCSRETRALLTLDKLQSFLKRTHSYAIEWQHEEEIRPEIEKRGTSPGEQLDQWIDQKHGEKLSKERIARIRTLGKEILAEVTRG